MELVNASRIPSAGSLVAAHPSRAKGLDPFYVFIAVSICVR